MPRDLSGKIIWLSCFDFDMFDELFVFCLSRFICFCLFVLSVFSRFHYLLNRDKHSNNQTETSKQTNHDK